MRAVIVGLAEQTRELLGESAGFARAIRDFRLSAEVALIQAFAEDLVGLLLTRDPLCEEVHHGKGRSAALALRALLRHGATRMFS